MHVLTQVYVTIRMDDAFTLNCRPTVPVGCEEQVVDAKCTRPFLPLVKGLAPRLGAWIVQSMIGAGDMIARGEGGLIPRCTRGKGLGYFLGLVHHHVTAHAPIQTYANI